MPGDPTPGGQVNLYAQLQIEQLHSLRWAAGQRRESAASMRRRMKNGGFGGGRSAVTKTQEKQAGEMEGTEETTIIP